MNSKQTLEILLSDIVQRLKESLSPDEIYLYGSCAYGHVGPDSDIDILVIVGESELSFFERGTIAYRALHGIEAPVDVQVYTRDEFESRADAARLI